ncbi:hypothetical protein [Nocardioides sp. CFH 31398]|uniref:hypothetical protein n=1 Tax=Nocardioides sp. CFH 31398 TaxID=2919579 RepID=UPI001F06F9D7|nr:hypothetical protein [Nocardioides sp. CFH 31398]MCH1867988.1 hypothetical protein [Nocardioides sp. CFH 31398]
MTDHDNGHDNGHDNAPGTGPDVLFRARRTALGPDGLQSAEAVRRRSDRRRRRQWASGTAAVAVLAVSAAVVPWSGGSVDDGSTLAVDRAVDEETAGTSTAGLGYTLPDGWEVLARPGERSTCVGPAGTDGCPVEIAVADDPTVGEDPLAQVTEDLDDGCLRTLAEVLRILSRSQGDPAASTYRAQCAAGGQDPGTTTLSTVVALDSGTASATTRDPDLTREARQIVASFEVPEGWRTSSRVSFAEPGPAA